MLWVCSMNVHFKDESGTCVTSYTESGNPLSRLSSLQDFSCTQPFPGTPFTYPLNRKTELRVLTTCSIAYFCVNDLAGAKQWQKKEKTEVPVLNTIPLDVMVPFSQFFWSERGERGVSLEVVGPATTTTSQIRGWDLLEAGPEEENKKKCWSSPLPLVTADRRSSSPLLARKTVVTLEFFFPYLLCSSIFEDTLRSGLPVDLTLSQMQKWKIIQAIRRPRPSS